MRVKVERASCGEREGEEEVRVVVSWHARSPDERREAVRHVARAVLRMLVRGARKLMYCILLRWLR